VLVGLDLSLQALQFVEEVIQLFLYGCNLLFRDSVKLKGTAAIVVQFLWEKSE
jgi:hypothetical protein